MLSATVTVTRTKKRFLISQRHQTETFHQHHLELKSKSLSQLFRSKMFNCLIALPCRPHDERLRIKSKSASKTGLMLRILSFLCFVPNVFYCFSFILCLVLDSNEKMLSHIFGCTFDDFLFFMHICSPNCCLSIRFIDIFSLLLNLSFHRQKRWKVKYSKWILGVKCS